MQYEIQVNTNGYIGDTQSKEIHIDNFILALARFGYTPYLTEENNVCFSIYSEEDIMKIEDKSEAKNYQKEML